MEQEVAHFAAIIPTRRLLGSLFELQELGPKDPKGHRRAGARLDDNRIRVDDALEACCEVRGFAHDPAFLGLPGADKNGDHDQTGRNAEALHWEFEEVGINR
jgi:hypothetical protein